MKIAITFFLLLAIRFAQDTPAMNDGNQLLKTCGSLVKEMDSALGDPSNSLMVGRCAGYLEGFFDGFEAMEAAGAPSLADYQRIRVTYICRPKGTTLGQNARVLVKWLADHPEKLHGPAYSLTYQAFIQTFPCRVGNQTDGYEKVTSCNPTPPSCK